MSIRLWYWSLLQHRLAKPLAKADLAKSRLAGRNPADRLGDIISRHGLNEYRWPPNRGSDGGFIRDALDELEELGRVND
jgi:hypothetical protein